ncbi:hypothetical protein [Allorhodopirellula heiligendammensis]|uniref:WYL domain-containing protein n=1 Tax=Allorhodopirellula heiligendammensis TaxID=2714739 RepID=A0A5C6BT24_9BACT|nr:hypothetical protein [Allorhodopirellula heiligendammensis]TWU15125.1 hypothetical protein Poly21_23170 [Allorhodopirellula heiligendammensis]
MTTLTLDPVNSTTPAMVTSPRRRKAPTPQQMLRIAMLDSDQWAVELDYADSKGKRTRRTVSPIRFSTPDRFLGLCLCREQPRQFYLDRCSNIRIVRSDDIIMPVAMVQLDD